MRKESLAVTHLKTPWKTSANSSCELCRCAASFSTSGVAGAKASLPMSTRLPVRTKSFLSKGSQITSTRQNIIRLHKAHLVPRCR